MGLFALAASLNILFLVNAAYNLDESNYIYICKNCTEALTISSSPSSGYIWYLYSEDETKVKINDEDGEYVKYTEDLGVQVFNIFCFDYVSLGDKIELILILKKPWNEDPTIINIVTVEVKNY